jgi:proline iminopeptidase
LTFDTLLDDIEYARRELGLSKCIVVGHSVHGLLALEYAKKYKEHVSHCVMIGTPPDMRERGFAMAQENWEEFAPPERKEAYELNMAQMPDEELNKLPRDKWFVQMNIRNAPKSWYNYNFDSGYLWEGVQPNVYVLDQVYLKFAREVDVSQGLESFDLPVLLAYGRFEFLVAPVHSWNFLRNKFSQLNICIFENSAHSPHYEESERFDDQLLKWLSTEKF